MYSSWHAYVRVGTGFGELRFPMHTRKSTVSHADNHLPSPSHLRPVPIDSVVPIVVKPIPTVTGFHQLSPLWSSIIRKIGLCTQSGCRRGVNSWVLGLQPLRFIWRIVNRWFPVRFDAPPFRPPVGCFPLKPRLGGPAYTSSHRDPMV